MEVRTLHVTLSAEDALARCQPRWRDAAAAAAAARERMAVELPVLRKMPARLLEAEAVALGVRVVALAVDVRVRLRAIQQRTHRRVRGDRRR